jgi:hypothetical protein
MTDKIKAILIFEILGAPKEHIVKALDEHVSVLGKDKGIFIIRKKIHEPKEIENEGPKGLYTTFAEVEIVVDGLDLLFMIVHNMLPSSIDIIEPESMNLKNHQANSILSDLTLKLHRYDEVAKTILLERNSLNNRIKELEEKLGLKSNQKESNKKKVKKKS